MQLKPILIGMFLFVFITMDGNSYASIGKSRNPFVFKEKQIKLYPRLELVMLSKNKKMAVISGKKYRVGDKFGKEVILTITLDYIILSRGNRSRKVFINEKIK